VDRWWDRVETRADGNRAGAERQAGEDYYRYDVPCCCPVLHGTWTATLTLCTSKHLVASPSNGPNRSRIRPSGAIAVFRYAGRIFWLTRKIDPDSPHQRQVNHEPIVTRTQSRPPRIAVRRLFSRPVRDCRHDIGDVPTGRDETRPLVDHGVVDAARGVVPLVAPLDHRTAKARARLPQKGDRSFPRPSPTLRQSCGRPTSRRSWILRACHSGVRRRQVKAFGVIGPTESVGASAGVGPRHVRGRVTRAASADTPRAPRDSCRAARRWLRLPTHR
jgi:hypothetical protein